MSDIEELQRRITAAMDRIAAGVEPLSVDTGADNAELIQALEGEKLASAQLGERVRAITERHDAELGDLKSASEAASERMSALDLELQRLRQANDALRQSNQDLRAANEAGVGEPDLINQAMVAELEALRAARAADVSETSAIIQALTPLIDQHDDSATTGGDS